MKIRKEVMKFVEAMELKLRKHDKEWGKTGWRGDKKLGLGPASNEILINGVQDNLKEYLISHKKKELVDIANFCMMLYDISK